MITAEFYRTSDNKLIGFSVSGHAGMADFGQDIVCASVSSAVMLTANTITEAFGIKAAAEAYENEILLKLKEDPRGEGDKLILGLLTHLYMLKEEFPKAINVKITEK